MDEQQKHNLSLGLGGVFRGLSDLLQIAVEIAESSDAVSAAARREGAIGSPKGLHAVYGVSVRVGVHGAPVVAPFGNVRQNERKEPVIDDEREPLVDVLDEGEYFLVVAELPGVGADRVSWDLRDRTLTLGASADERRYFKKIQLLEPVEQQTAVSCYDNGVLQVKVWKRRR